MANYNKILRIVSVKLEDGTERAVDDAALMRYLQRRSVVAAFPGMDPYAAFDMVTAMQTVLRQEKSETNSKNAAPPRNAFAKDPEAKAKLLAFKRDYEIAEAKTHGWETKASERFLIDRKTLKRILDRP